MDELAVRDIALFFFFCLLDEEKAYDFSSRAVDEFYELKRKHPTEKVQILVVRATYKIWKKLKSKIQRGRPQITKQMGWTWPHDINFGPWMEYQKNAIHDEFIVSIWALFLKYSDDEIANGLEMTPGTIRYRLGHALKKLGTYV
ncbi:MAG: hypothetical protein AABY64_01465 [Bdellovibrionota bacterium]